MISRGRPREFGAAGVGHDAEGAELVAALLHRQEGADPRSPLRSRADGRTSASAGKLVSRMPPPARGRRARPSRAGGDRSAGRRPCRRTARARMISAPSAWATQPATATIMLPPVAPSRCFSRRIVPSSEKTFSAAFSRMWQVLRMTRSAPSGRSRHGIAERRQQIGHARRIVDVHLAAVGLDEEALGHQHRPPVAGEAVVVRRPASAARSARRMGGGACARRPVRAAVDARPAPASSQ